MSTSAGQQIEPMRWWDIERVSQLEQLLFATDSPWPPAMFWSELAAGHHYVVLRSSAGLIVGYAGLAAADDELAEIQTIGVHPAVRRAGIGRTLLGELLRAADGRRVLLDVRTDNAAAIGLYTAHGFVRIGLRRRYYQPSGTDAYTMQRAPTAVSSRVTAL